MKKSELNQLIKEEINKVLKEVSMNPTELLGNIKDILNNSPELGELEVTTVESKKGKYLQILDSNNNSVGIYISMINPDN
jgi:hypothetical protein